MCQELITPLILSSREQNDKIPCPRGACILAGGWGERNKHKSENSMWGMISAKKKK